MLQAADESGMSYSSARRKEAGLRNGSSDSAREVRLVRDAYPGAIALDRLNPKASKALDDFAFFRRRYFGRKSTPWQEEAGNRILQLSATRNKEFVVINCPPGSGKSTLFTLDIPAWLTVRRRSIRGMIGSASQSLAERYLLRLRQAFESPFPMMAEGEELELGLAFDAQATLIEDFGLFKPPGSVMWTTRSLIVAQQGDRMISEKEPTWSAYGLDTAFIGGRFDVAVWDDATEDRHMTTLEMMEKQRNRWDKVAEKRLEPGGLLVLQGQRLGPEDLYRHALNKKAGSSSNVDHGECCSAENNRKYHHIIYRAHWEDRCTEVHDIEAYYPDSCLLDPHRLPWVELEAEMENSSSNYLQVYQQEDMDPEQTLVHPMWIKGGSHPQTREIFPGCWDNDRGLWELPAVLSAPWVTYMTVDPSPTKWWAVQAWCYHPESKLRFLLDLMKVKMGVNQFLDWHSPSGQFEGVAHEWWERSVALNMPITTMVFEANAAQRFFLATQAIRDWQAATGVRVIGHETYAANKLDRELGPQILAQIYRRGLIRLPGRGEEARLTSLKLIEEVTKWPKGGCDDQVMAQWFGEYNLEHIYDPTPFIRFDSRPDWLRPQVATV